MCLEQDPLRGAAEQEFADGGTFPQADDHEIGLVFLGSLNDVFGCVVSA